ncbi:hypothetical protein BGZ70_008755 [Mortierella alpina]|uniref:Tail specific protease domain-containing protein n=1 Tax=Mortierella alpina TaxID=64518 RepID=A0A9P6J4Z6_MORAP|nr:hypothetical protein BGZ70_008755 [Mortierella alpina]
MPSLVKLLLLSTALAAVANAAPNMVGYPDHCSLLAKAKPGRITYQEVANCYRSIDFNLKQAKATIETLTTFYNDAFVFRDVALTPNLKSPLTASPVDAMEGLKRIGQKRYRNDFDFHQDLSLFAMSFNDAHVTYAPQCYSSYIFLQPLYLYAPVINDSQSVRVRHDATKSGLEDCEVVRINGQNARDIIQRWADKHTGFSKDAGVRFNHALASKLYWPDTKIWLDVPGMFSFRYRLPETQFIDYELKCDGQYSRKFRGQWKVIPMAPEGSFSDKTSFVSNLCMHSTSNETTEPAVEPGVLTTVLGSLYESEHGRPDTSLKDLPDAKLWASNNTAAYQLKSMPHVGVLVVPTMEIVSQTEIPSIQGYMTLLANQGVTHIIIDMSGNFGGEEEFASLLPGVFFKSHDKSIHAHRTRFRVTPAIQALAEANLRDLNPKHSTYWDPRELADTATFTPFKTNPFITGVEDLAFNGRSAAFSQEVFNDYDQEIIDSTLSYPWSNDASKITILTDGQCGSACGMTSDYFVHRHGVKAVAVGGHHNTPLSMFSFPGASVLDTDSYVESFEKLGLKPTFQRLPYENSVSVGVTMVYSDNDTVPLEYNSARFPAAFRLDYNPAIARNQDQLWAAVARAAWK